jgi:hypothetical protein
MDTGSPRTYWTQCSSVTIPTFLFCTFLIPEAGVTNGFHRREQTALPLFQGHVHEGWDARPARSVSRATINGSITTNSPTFAEHFADDPIGTSPTQARMTTQGVNAHELHLPGRDRRDHFVHQLSQPGAHSPLLITSHILNCQPHLPGCLTDAHVGCQEKEELERDRVQDFSLRTRQAWWAPTVPDLEITDDTPWPPGHRRTANPGPAVGGSHLAPCLPEHDRKPT